GNPLSDCCRIGFLGALFPLTPGERAGVTGKKPCEYMALQIIVCSARKALFAATFVASTHIAKAPSLLHSFPAAQAGPAPTTSSWPARSGFWPRLPSCLSNHSYGVRPPLAPGISPSRVAERFAGGGKMRALGDQPWPQAA